MAIRVFVILLSQFLVFCSSELDHQFIASTINGENAKEDSEEDDSEEITAIPPTIISGAHLVCLPQEKNEEAQTMHVLCHLESNGEILKDVILLESDFIIMDENNEKLGFTIFEDNEGIYSLELFLEDAIDVIICLESIDGIEIEQTSDGSSLKSVLKVDEGSNTEEKPEEITDFSSDAIEEPSETESSDPVGQEQSPPHGNT